MHDSYCLSALVNSELSVPLANTVPTVPQRHVEHQQNNSKHQRIYSDLQLIKLY